MRIKTTTLLLIATVAFVIAPSLASGASLHAQETTTFKGRFVCDYDGRPMGGAQVSIHGETPHALAATQFSVTYPPKTAGPDGDWSFTVPRDANQSFLLNVELTGGGVTVKPYPDPQPVLWYTDSNYNDKAVQDYQTQPMPGAACALWVALRNAVADYRRLVGHGLPFGDLTVQYGGPNVGTPYTDYLTIVWPTDYPVSDVAARHEFAHAIRNATLPQWRFLQEVQDADFRLRGSPCRRTTERYAFHEGWAEFWAGDFSPAPLCFGDQEVKDPDTEGAVAWRLTNLERSCAAYSRRRLVQVLLNRGSDIHTLHDLVSAIGTCQAVPLSPGSVPRYQLPKPTVDRWSHDVQASISRERGGITTLTKLLPGLDQAAAGASCPRPPCTGPIGARIAPILARGELQQARLFAATLGTISVRAAADLRRKPTQTTIDLVTKVPAALARGTGAIGATTMTKALAAARPLARGDSSASTKALISTLTTFRSAYLRSSRTGSAVPAGAPTGSPPPPTESGGNTHIVTFDGFADGTMITTQTQAAKVKFGAPPALRFPAQPPRYLCPYGPVVEQNVATVAGCDSPLGFPVLGTMAKFDDQTAVRTVSLRIGASQAIPGGLPVELNAFDSAGVLLSRNAVLVGSSTNGQPPGPVTPLGVKVSKEGHPITFVAIFVNSGIHDPTKLVFDDLVFTESKV